MIDFDWSGREGEVTYPGFIIKDFTHFLTAELARKLIVITMITFRRFTTILEFTES